MWSTYTRRFEVILGAVSEATLRDPQHPSRDRGRASEGGTLLEDGYARTVVGGGKRGGEAGGPGSGDKHIYVAGRLPSNRAHGDFLARHRRPHIDYSTTIASPPHGVTRDLEECGNRSGRSSTMCQVADRRPNPTKFRS